MILRTLFFFILLYFLVKVLSRLFLPSGQKRRSRSGFDFFYTRNNHQGQQQKRSGENMKQRLDHIEEAEYEEVKEEEAEKPNSG